MSNCNLIFAPFQRTRCSPRSVWPGASVESLPAATIKRTMSSCLNGRHENNCSFTNAFLELKYLSKECYKKKLSVKAMLVFFKTKIKNSTVSSAVRIAFFSLFPLVVLYLLAYNCTTQLTCTVVEKKIRLHHPQMQSNFFQLKVFRATRMKIQINSPGATNGLFRGIFVRKA